MIFTLKTDKLASCEAFVLVVENILGNQRAENYAKLIEKMLTAYELLDARMS